MRSDLLEERRRLIVPLLVGERDAPAIKGQGFGEARGERRGIVPGDGGLCRARTSSQVVAGDGVIRFDPQGLVVAGGCLVQPIQPGQDDAEVVVRFGVQGPQAYGLAKAGDGLLGFFPSRARAMPRSLCTASC